jgi:hypothetical protein
MGDEFHAIIKMISGEEVLSLVMVDENDGDPILVLQNPVVVKMSENKHGSFIKVKPWVELSDDDFFIVRQDKIITMTETTDKKLINIYTQYITDSSDEDIDEFSQYGKVKPSEKMGYISTVKEARKKLEDIFKLEVEDTKES